MMKRATTLALQALVSIISCLWTSLLWSVYPVVCQFPSHVFSLDFLPTGGFNPIPFPQALLATSWGSTVKLGYC